MLKLKIRMMAVILFAVFFSGCEPAYPAEIQTASYYTYESARREGTSGITASGEKFRDSRLTCASWFYPFGTILKVTSLNNGRSINVTVNDRGPAKRLVKKGRVIDLSKKAFESISPLSAGVIPVRIERLS